jgi:hypothetical protein
MSTNQPESTTDRLNRLAMESTQTLIDAAYLAQRQSADLLRAWLNSLDATQQQQRDIATKLVEQTQEAQHLLRDFVRESTRASLDVATRASQPAGSTAAKGTTQAADTVQERRPASE